MPREHCPNSEPGPPSSQSPSEASEHESSHGDDGAGGGGGGNDGRESQSEATIRIVAPTSPMMFNCAHARLQRQRSQGIDLIKGLVRSTTAAALTSLNGVLRSNTASHDLSKCSLFSSVMRTGAFRASDLTWSSASVSSSPCVARIVRSGGGGDGGCARQRGPQSPQSSPTEQRLNSLPIPPSSQNPSCECSTQSQP